MKLNKMMKTASALDRLLKILQVILAAAVVLLLAASAFLLLFGFNYAAAAGDMTNSISFGILTLSTAHGAALKDTALLTQSVQMSALLFTVLCALVWYGISLVRSILAPMKAGEPFIAGISAKLKKLGWFVLIAGLLEQVFSWVSAGMLLRAYDLSLLFNLQVVEKYTMNFTLNLSFAAAAVILFLLAYVFRYGEELQKESDETL